ncbi:TetR family transcriptional regulator [Frondihabitans sp. PhB188]|uniref:TetR/AcrR family transcriptional regulator n=1 Tax=Frondihabitans sp. PhB188 TaxID=2485200 RepID=UPI000F4A235D|nr:TetR/AcrR family transcriptional regulator [Frondihabitans sp. PhB188]ROQ36559.1 TetR family transcriptional regulator [Frondihabitans sp. PhB188]
MTSDPDARQLRVRSALVSQARRRTAESGLSGFTVQELCDGVGISRRTFFNYFPTKESAVLGVENSFDDDLLGAFLEARDRDASSRRPLVDDLTDLAVEHFAAMGPTASDLDDLVGALQREPKLITAMIQSGRAEQELLIDRITARRGHPDRVEVEVALVAFQALVRLAFEAVLRGDDDVAFADLLHARVESARALFAPPPPTSATAAATRSLVHTT